MRVSILIGQQKSPKEGTSGLVNLYTGLNGVELEAKAEEAAKTGEYSYLGRITNPITAPMAITGDPIKRTTPTFVRPKAKDTGGKANNDHLKGKRDGVKVYDLNQQKPATGSSSPSLKDGPSFEEWVAAGYDPKTYPPVGYISKESPAWAIFKQSNPASPAPAAVPAGNNQTAGEPEK